nr:alpha/beta hydrolase [Sphingomonas sp. Y57]
MPADHQEPPPAPGPDAELAIPFTRFASAEAEAAWERRDAWKADFATWRAADPARQQLPGDEAFWRWFREEGDHLALAPLVAAQRARYDVLIEPVTLNGVPAVRIMPKARTRREDRLLINLHGGAFMGGDGPGLLVGAIPIAAETGIDVVSVDYRLAPEHRHPAALEDALAVFGALQDHAPSKRIGVYGCSAGAMLAAQLVAALSLSGRPGPGAVAMLCGTGELFARGDSAYHWAMLNGLPLAGAELRQDDRPYLRGADDRDRTLFPMRHAEVLAQFPPSLLVSGSRSYEMSTMTDAHNRLSLAAVPSHLHIWDGVTHGFVHNAELPESRQAYALIRRFFERYLGGNDA